MYLFEAIRLGAMLRPQIFGQDSTSEGTCAFGAAREALGRGAFLFPAIEWPFLVRYMACPDCGEFDEPISTGERFPIRLLSIVSCHLNDHHRWTREAIADFLEPIELAYEAEQAKAAQPEAVSV